MNVSDTEQAEHAVAAAGLALAAGPEEADVVMLNTCSVRAKAERKVLARVDELHHLKRGRDQLVGVMGCVAQLEGEGLFDRSGRVGLVAGTQALERLPQLIEEAYTRKMRVVDLGGRDEADSARVGERAGIAYRHSKYVGFVPIIEGCNKFCSYCIVPYSRGREVSRPAQEIIREVEYLQGVGVKEVHLIGQNVNSYRPASDNILPAYSGATPFSKLLRAVAGTGMPRIKFTTSFPRDFHYDIVTALEEHENLCNWIHLPVQSGSDKILRAMRRGYTRSEYLGKVEKIRESSRQLTLTTDIIVGYPGETDEDFDQTLSLFQAASFDSAYLFKYSPRTGTPAAQLNNDLLEDSKSHRFNVLQQLQKETTQNSLKKQLGSTLKVLLEKQSNKDSRDISGHSTCHRVVNVPAPTNLIGQIATVKITEVKANSLYGEIVSL